MRDELMAMHHQHQLYDAEESGTATESFAAGAGARGSSSSQAPPNNSNGTAERQQPSLSPQQHDA